MLQQILGLLRREDGGRLVEDEDAGPEIEQTQDLHPLLLPDGELPDPCSRIDAETISLAQRRELPFDPRRLQIDASPLFAEHDILRDRERVDEHEVLVDHADAARDGVAGRTQPDRHAVDLDLTTIWPVEASQDAHQRRLAGAVLSDQGVDFTPGRLEIDTIIRHHRSEALADVAHRDRGWDEGIG